MSATITIKRETLILLLIAAVIFVVLLIFKDDEDTPYMPVGNNEELSSWEIYHNETYEFEVKYPQGAKILEVPSGFDDKISAIDFNNVYGISIRVRPYENSRHDKTLVELFQIRNGVSMVETGNLDDYRQQIRLKGTVGLKRINTLPGGERIGSTAIILGDSYYYVISTGSQFTPGFDEKKEQIFNEFLYTFKFTE